VVRANLTAILQLKKGQYRAELAIRLADDILPTEIKDRARAVVEKCRNAADGKLVQFQFHLRCVPKYGFSITTPLSSCFPLFTLIERRKERNKEKRMNEGKLEGKREV
jgi:hypothetical protein